MVELPAELVREIWARNEVHLIFASAVAGRGSCPHEPQHSLVADCVTQIISARRGVPWRHPNQTEDQVDRLRHEIRALRTQIGELDPHAARIAHDDAHGARIRKLEDRMQQLDCQMGPDIGSESLLAVTNENYELHTEWERLIAEDNRIDRATMAALDRLDRALSASVNAAAEAAVFQKPGENPSASAKAMSS